MDQGRQTFLVRLVPHAGDWRDADVVRLAAELNQPPFALIETFHDGPLPQRASYGDDGGGASSSRSSSAARTARVRSCAPTRRRAVRPTRALELLGATIEADFGAERDQDVRATAVEADLLEW